MSATCRCTTVLRAFSSFISLVLAAGGLPAQVQFDELSRRSITNDVPTTWDIASADFNCDGFPDLVFANFARTQNKLFLNDGTGDFVDMSLLNMPYVLDNTHSIACGDVDGDGDVDMVVGNGRFDPTAFNHLLLNDGNGVFSLAQNRLPPVDSTTLHVLLVDLDADAALDIVTAEAGQNRIYLNDGFGYFRDATSTHLPRDTNWSYGAASGDFDGDGDEDLVFGNSVIGPSGQNGLYLNDGLGRFTDVTSTHMPANADITTEVETDDIDGDGDLDLVLTSQWRIAPGAQNRIYINDGAARFVDATSTLLPARLDQTWAVSLADVDLDDDPDIFFGNIGSDALYLNDGHGVFVDASGSRLPATSVAAQATLIADLDLDGDPDILVAGWDQGVFSSRALLYTNLYRQLWIPVQPRVGLTMPIDMHATPGFGTIVQPAQAWISFQLSRPPVNIPPFGCFRLDPTTLVAGPVLQIPPATGKASLLLPIANVQSLVGLPFHVQAGMLHSTQPRDWRLSNLLSERIQR